MSMLLGLIATQQNANDDKERLIMTSQDKPTKTKYKLRIENLQYCIKASQDNINRYKREIEELKPTVHY